MAEKLKYLGVEFDEWVEGADDEGNKTYWTNICPTCAEQNDQLEEDIDFETGSFACCGVCGCDYSGEDDDNEGTHYIDFNPPLVEFDDIDYEVEYLANGVVAYEGGFDTLQEALDSLYVLEKDGYAIHRRYWKTPINDKFADIETCEVAWEKDI